MADKVLRANRWLRRETVARTISPAVLLAALALALLSLACDAGPERAADERPNVIFVVLDTLRADHLELYGYAKATAPFLARVGAHSAVFTSAFSSSSWTAPSTATLFTGLYPTRHGVTRGLIANLTNVREAAQRGDQASIQVGSLPSSVPSLPEHFQRLGYRTYGIATNVNIGEPLGFERGFDSHARLTAEPAEKVLETLKRWRPEIEANPPYFLYLHLDDAHKPYNGREPWFVEEADDRATLESAYDSEIHYMDARLGEMLALFGFDPAGAEDPAGRKTVVVIASDHGEEFWDHGLNGHHFSLHYELNRIVLMINGPGVPAAVFDDNVSGVDVLPTLLDLVGAPAPDDLDGRSLTPLFGASGPDGAAKLRGELATRPLLAHRADRRTTGGELWSVLVGPFRLISTPEGDQLYDLATDTAELDDLSEKFPERVAALKAQLERFQTVSPVEPAADIAVPLSPTRLEQLRSLGYVEEDSDP
jgi:choline-sulfatase